MVKRQIVIRAIGAAALALSGIAFAMGGGYETPSTAFADTGDTGAGFYLKGQVGYGLSHWDYTDHQSALITNNNLFNSLVVTNENGFTGRVGAGYAFNRYLGIEGGWTYLPSTDVRFKSRTDGSLQATARDSWAVDLSAVMSVPLYKGFGTYGSVGIDYVNTEMRGNAATVPHGTISNIGVVFGAGLFYDIPSTTVRLLAGWNRFGGNGNISTKYQPDRDIFTAGISYRLPFDMFDNLGLDLS